VRLKSGASLTPTEGFNPRTHAGCDVFGKLTFCHDNCFNPRTHAGCDFGLKMSSHLKIVSIHAPTRGATSMELDMAKRHEVSIHAPTRGATFDSGGFFQVEWFQSTHPRGVRLYGRWPLYFG